VRQWRALAVLGVVATLVGVGGTSAEAAPLVSPITRVGPDDLTAAIVIDISSDGRWVLAGGFGGVQRIDRIGNVATAPIATPNLDVGLTDDGGTMLSVEVDLLGEVTVVRTSPGSGNVNEVVAGSLGAGNWTRSGPIAVSSTGRFVVFTATDSISSAQTVAVADTQGPFSVTRVDAGLPAGTRSASPSISRDGRFIGFTAASAPPGCTDGPGCGDVWVYDRATGVGELVSVRAAGGPSTGASELARVSGNGRFVAFVSDATDLVAGTPNRTDRLYVRDLQTDRTMLANGRPSDGPFGARAPSVSDDGRLVAFSGRGTANVGGTPTEVDQVLVADLADGSVVQVPLRPNGEAPDSNSVTPHLRADGTEVVFASSATDLVNPPTLGGWLLYAARIGGPESASSGQTLPRARYVPMTPARVLDTRDGTGGWPVGQRPSTDTTVTVQVGGVAGVPANASAVALNVTATDARAAGYVTVYPTGGTRPLASNLNVEQAGQTIANFVVVPLGTNSSVSIYTQSGTHFVADVLGYFLPAQNSASGRYRALTPFRMLDTRDGTGGAWPAGVRPGVGDTVTVPILGRGGVPADGVSAVVLNVTATEARDAGFVTVFPGGAARPLASNLNLQRVGQTIPNLVIVPVGSGGTVNLFTQRGTHLIADVAGYFTDGTAATSNSGLFVPFRPVRLTDSRAPFPVPLPEAASTRYRITVPPIPASDVAAALLNVTAVNAADRMFLTVHPAGAPRPLASNLNVERAGQIIPNAVIATLAGGSIDIYTQKSTDLVIDASGYFRA
jgi:Tol biopolymer transport system component